MSMLDTIGGLSGGLGGSGGVGGSIPSNSSAANSAATATINPTTVLSGTIGGGEQSYGPFSINFPGVQTQGLDSVNSPPITTALLPKGIGLIAAAIVALVAMLFIFKR